MSTLDLLQLDRDCMLNQVLRRNWLERTGIDPLAAGRSEERKKWRQIVGGIFLFQTIAAFWLVNWGMMDKDFSAWDLLYAPVVLLSSILVVSSFARNEDLQEADNFTEALEKLHKVFGPDCTTLARLGEKELKAKADEHLSSLAGVIKVDEKESASLAELTRSKFRDAHQLFRDFLLVEKQWDRFFKQESKDEQAETTGSLDIIRGDEGNPVMDFVQS